MEAYAPSWVDRVTDWIDRPPWPAWVFYVALYLAYVVVLHLVDWLNGTHAWGSISLLALYNAIWTPAVLMAIHHTDRLADGAMRRFTLTVGDKTREAQAIRHRMTTLPQRVALPLYLVPMALLLVASYRDPSFAVYTLPEAGVHPVAMLLAALATATSYAFAFVLIYHVVRQLILASRALALVETVNLFQQRHLYSFSGLAMWTALWLLSFVWVTFLGNLLYEPSASERAFNFALSLVIIPVAIGIVLFPLSGIHRRLVDAKLNLLEDNARQADIVRIRLRSAIEQDDLGIVKTLDDTLVSLNRAREHLTSAQTWPWATGAFRTFFSAISVPFVLFLLQTVIGRLLEP